MDYTASPEIKLLQKEDEDDISCQTGVTTVQATNVRRMTISPSRRMQAQGVEGRDESSLRRIVAELFWLVSVAPQETDAVVLRRCVLASLWGLTLRAGTLLQYNLVYHIVLTFCEKSTKHLSGDFMVSLMDTLNARDPNTNSFIRRRNLGSLIDDLLSDHPSELSSVVQEEQLSDLTCQNGGTTADSTKVRRLEHGQPARMDIAGLNLQGGTDVRAPLEEDSFAGGWHLSEGTPEDKPMPVDDKPIPVDAIIARFRAGNFDELEKMQVIAALSSGIEVMRSLLDTNERGYPGSNEPRGHSEDDF